MIKHRVLIAATAVISIQAMEVSNKKPVETKQLSIKQLQLEHKILREKLTEKPEIFWMWTPEQCGLHDIYQAKNKDQLAAVTQLCTPEIRIRNCSAIGIIAIAQHISLQDKREVIQRLPKPYQPTVEDKHLNVIETLQRCKKEEIDKKTYLLLCMYKYSNQLQRLPREIIHYIAELLVNTESVLSVNIPLYKKEIS